MSRPGLPEMVLCLLLGGEAPRHLGVAAGAVKQLDHKPLSVVVADELETARDLASHPVRPSSPFGLVRAVPAPSATVRCWESGHRTPAPVYRPALAEALSVSLDGLDVLLGFAEGPVIEAHVVPPLLGLYDSLVAGAGRVNLVEKSIVHGLLQTRDYGLAAHATGNQPAAQIAEVVEGRIARQAVLTCRKDPLDLRVLLCETVLYDVVGGPGVMARQLDYLVASAARPNIDLRLLPANGCSARVGAGFELLTKQGEVAPYLAVSVDPSGRPRFEDDLTRFADLWHNLAEAALTPEETVRCIEDINHTRYR